MTTTPKAIRIPNELLTQLDKARGDVTRTRWIIRAIEQRLSNEANAGQSSKPPNAP